jgi:hypothetical protein
MCILYENSLLNIWDTFLPKMTIISTISNAEYFLL